MDPEMVKLQTEVHGLRERVSALELADKAIQEKVAREAADALAAAKEEADKKTFWKKKEASTDKK